MEKQVSKIPHSFATIEMQPRVVLYIDLLGFKSKADDLEPTSQKQIINFYNFLRENFKSDGYAENIGEGATSIQTSSSFFSDSLVSSYPANISQLVWKSMYPDIDPKIEPAALDLLYAFIRFG
jgi:hypothetical protein